MSGWNPRRLEEAMVLRELSNQELSERLGVSWRTVARWKNDFNKEKYHPTIEQIWKTSQILDFPYKYFITEDNFEVKSEGIFY